MEGVEAREARINARLVTDFDPGISTRASKSREFNEGEFANRGSTSFASLRKGASHNDSLWEFVI